MGEDKIVTVVLSGTITGGSITNIISPQIEFEHTAEALELYVLPIDTTVAEATSTITPFWATGIVPGVGGSYIPQEAEPLLPPPTLVNGIVNPRYGSVLVSKSQTVRVIPAKTTVERYTQYGLNVSNPNTVDLVIQGILLLRPTKGE